MYTLVLSVLEQGHYCVPPLGELWVYTMYTLVLEPGQYMCHVRVNQGYTMYTLVL